MTDAELRATREAKLAAHMDGETNMDAEAVLATMADPATYELVSIGRTLRGRDEIVPFLNLMFGALPGIVHRAVRFHHTPDAVIVESETDFPNGLDGSTPGQVVTVPAIAVFPFDGEVSLGERLYADMGPLEPYLPSAGAETSA